MANEAFKTSLKETALPLCVLLASLFAYPLLYVYGVSCDVKLFAPSALSALALAALLLAPGRLVPALAANPLFPTLPIAVLALLSALHFALDGRWKFEDLCLSLSWVALPALAWTNPKAMKSLLPPFLALLWTVNLALSLLDLLQGRSLGGLPGNWNWDIALALLSSPFAALTLGSLLERLKAPRPRLCASFAIALPTVWLFWKCDSRAAWVSIVSVAALFAFLELGPKGRRLFAATALAAALAAGAALSFKGVDSMARLLSSDVRGPLWDSAIAFAADHAWLGAGESSFESEFAPYRSPEYFLNPNASVRTNHPHNNLLFMASCFGVFGLLAWLALTVYPVVYLCVSYGSRGLFEKLCLFAFVSAFAHALFDLILYEWPTSIATLLLLGTLWSVAWPAPEPEPANGSEGAKTLTRATKAAGLLVGLAALLSAGLCLAAHWNALKAAALKRADNSLAPLAAHYSALASELCRTSPLILYRATTSAYLNARNADLTLHHIEQMDGTPFWNFAHVNGFRSKCLALKGRFREAEPYALAECRNYPLQLLPLFSLTDIYRRSGQLEKASEAQSAFETLMKLRGIDETGFRAILKNPDLDLHFRKPEEGRSE